MTADADAAACFGCGPHNPSGLRLHFHPTPDGVRADVTLGEGWQSWPGRVHGGVVASVLDEALAWAVQAATGRRVVTTTLRVRYVAPVRVGSAYEVRARLLPSQAGGSGLVLRGVGELLTPAGEIVAAADGSFVEWAEGAADGG